MIRIGVISDTHGLLRPEAAAALAGVSHILHAGDVGEDAILDMLDRIAPVTAIRGNVDTGGRCGALPETQLVELEGKRFYLVHSRDDLDIKPEAAGIDVVLCGHSHRSSVEDYGSVTYLNPGSAGPRRFGLPVTLALVEIENGNLSCRILELVS